MIESNAVLQRMAMNDYTQTVNGEYHGVYEEVKQAVNGVIDRVRRFISAMTNIAAGDLSDLESFRAIGNGTGRRCANDEFAPSVTRVMENLTALIEDTNMLAVAAVEGKLETRADASKHQGDFRKIVQGVNDTLDSLINPLKKCIEHMEHLSIGIVDDTITADYKGDYIKLKDSFNMAFAAINLLVSDTVKLSDAAVAGNLSTRADDSKHREISRR